MNVTLNLFLKFQKQVHNNKNYFIPFLLVNLQTNNTSSKINTLLLSFINALPKT